jgi:hypothetical protein
MKPAKPMRNPLQNPMQNHMQNPCKTPAKRMCCKTPLYPHRFRTPALAGGVQPTEASMPNTKPDIFQRRVTRAIEPILDAVTSQPPTIYRDSLRQIAEALRDEADEIEILANERF